MLLDDLMPQFDVHEFHATRVAAEPAAVYRAVRSVDLSEIGLLQALLALRMLPSLLRHPCRTLARRPARLTPPNTSKRAPGRSSWFPGGEVPRRSDSSTAKPRAAGAQEGVLTPLPPTPPIDLPLGPATPADD